MLWLLVLTGCTVKAEQWPTNADTNRTAKTDSAISKVSMKTLNKNKLEAVSSVGYDGTYIRASVISHGCTHSDDFMISHEIIDGRCNVTIERAKPDLCRRAPMLAEIRIEWSAPDSCIDLELVIANPVLVTANDGRITKRSK